MLGNFSFFLLSSAYFFKKKKKSFFFFRNTSKVTNGLAPDQDGHSVHSGMGPNSLLIGNNSVCLFIWC